MSLPIAIHNNHPVQYGRNSPRRCSTCMKGYGMKSTTCANSKCKKRIYACPRCWEKRLENRDWTCGHLSLGIVNDQIEKVIVWKC